MVTAFQTIGLMGKKRHQGTQETLLSLYHYLVQQGHRVLIEHEIASELNLPDLVTRPKQDLGAEVDLVIVVGGDGSMLAAARSLAIHDVPVIGINRGYLGFLTDISAADVHCPTELKDCHISPRLQQILAGHYEEERRFLLETQVIRDGVQVDSGNALNDVVLFPLSRAQVIEFEVYINGQFVCSLRSDGLIISTPTGSTAYALSGGGPIMHPSLNAVVLVPICPHTLSSRPIVVDGNSQIELAIPTANDPPTRVSCDGQIYLDLQQGDRIRIRRHQQALRLLHPQDYDYYSVLRTKLGWGTKL